MSLFPAVLKISDRRRLTLFFGSCQNVHVMERRKVESLASPQLDLDPMTFRSCPFGAGKTRRASSRAGNM